MVAADYDRDGRVDLAVGLVGGGIRLLRNDRAPEGLRVTLGGTAGNPAALGTRVRLVRAGTPGPVREVLGSTDGRSACATLPPFPPVQAGDVLWVQWPGRPPLEIPLTAGAGECHVPFGGGAARSAP